VHFSLLRFPPSTLEGGWLESYFVHDCGSDWQPRSFESETSPAPTSPWIWYVYNNMEFKLRTVSLTNIDCAFLNRLLYSCTVNPSVHPSRVCLPVYLHVHQNVFGRTIPSGDNFSRLRFLEYVGKTVELILLFVIIELYSYCSFTDHTVSEVIGRTLRYDWPNEAQQPTAVQYTSIHNCRCDSTLIKSMVPNTPIIYSYFVIVMYD